MWIDDAQRLAAVNPDNSFFALEQRLPTIYDRIPLGNQNDYDQLRQNIEYNSCYSTWEFINGFPNNPFPSPLDVFDSITDGHRGLPIFKTWQTWFSEFKDMYRALNGYAFPGPEANLKYRFRYAISTFLSFDQVHHVNARDTNWSMYVTRAGNYLIEYRIIIGIPLINLDSFAALTGVFYQLWLDIKYEGERANNSFDVLDVTFALYRWTLQSNFNLNMTDVLSKYMVAQSAEIRTGKRDYPPDGSPDNAVFWLNRFIDYFSRDDPTMDSDQFGALLSFHDLFNYRMYVSNKKLFELFEQLHERYSLRRTHTFALMITFRCVADRQQWLQRRRSPSQDQSPPNTPTPVNPPSNVPPRQSRPSRRSTRIALNNLVLPPRVRRPPRRYSPSPPRRRQSVPTRRQQNNKSRSKTTPR